MYPLEEPPSSLFARTKVKFTMGIQTIYLHVLIAKVQARPGATGGLIYNTTEGAVLYL